MCWLRIEWTIADRDYSFLCASGRTRWQRDRATDHRGDHRYQPGDTFAVRFAVAPLADIPPGEYAMGVYSDAAPLKSNGAERISLGPLTVQAATHRSQPMTRSGGALRLRVQALQSAAITPAIGSRSI
jgi:hypothetical protein